MSDDDWRVRVTYPDAEHGAEIEAALQAGTIDPDLIGHGVIISNESRENELFLYAGTRDFAERAEQAVGQAADTLKLTVDTELTQWHPVAERWEAPDAPLPETPEQLAAERAEVDSEQRADTAAIGHGAFEVRIELPNREAAIDLAGWLTGQGIDHLRRVNLVILAAVDASSTAELIDRVRPQLPDGATLSSGASWDEAERVADAMPVSFWRLFRRNEPETL